MITSSKIIHRLSQSRLGNEVNIGSIQALEQQIKEHELAIIRLKRSRNSLLNVSRLPPEILGDIFRRNVTLTGLFDGLGEESHNFLLVCHYWFEVASCTPDLWSFWGNNLRDWTKLHLRHPTAPLDLVLYGSWNKGRSLHESLRNALQDRAMRDALRRIHLVARDSELLDSIISPLARCGEIRSSSVESVIIRDEGGSVNLSDFFAFHCFPKLQHLELSNFSISSWDLLNSRTSALTTLDLNFDSPLSTPTTAQLLLILNSNPTLRRVSISGIAIPDPHSSESSLRVSLPYLRELDLNGNTRHVFGFLHKLDHPATMNSLVISAVDSTTDDISETVGPYFGDYLRRRGKSRSGLGLYLSSKDCIEIQVGDVGGIDFSALGPAQMDKFMEITIYLDQLLPDAAAILDLIAHAPREEIVYFRTYGRPVTAQAMSAQFPRLKALHFEGTPLPVAFPGPNPDQHADIFLSLQRVNLDRVIVPHGDWGPLTTFLARRASSGRRLDTLEINGPVVIRAEVMESLRGAVGVFRLTDIRPSPQVRWARLG